MGRITIRLVWASQCVAAIANGIFFRRRPLEGAPHQVPRLSAGWAINGRSFINRPLGQHRTLPVNVRHRANHKISLNHSNSHSALIWMKKKKQNSNLAPPAGTRRKVCGRPIRNSANVTGRQTCIAEVRPFVFFCQQKVGIFFFSSGRTLRMSAGSAQIRRPLADASDTCNNACEFCRDICWRPVRATAN